LETQPTETEGKQEKKKIVGKTNDGKELEAENRKFICFVPLFSSAFIFTLLNRFPFKKNSARKPYPLHTTKRHSAWASPRSAKEAGGGRQNKKRKILAQIF
jgi:hypothetical protein